MKKYYFINKFDSNYIDHQKKNTAIIYRNYNNKNDIKTILNLKNYCKRKGLKFYLSNDIKLSIKLNLDGAYIPSFNKSTNHLSFSLKKKFLIIGSAHNYYEIRNKEKQKIDLLFLSSIFKKNKNYLGINRFKLISTYTKKKVVALGGISEKNINKLSLTNCFGFAGISFFEQKKGPKKGPFL